MSTSAVDAIYPGHFAGYSATKSFNNVFSRSLYYEFASSGIDFLSLMPIGVSTPLTMNAKLSTFVITPADCAKGTLDKMTSCFTLGGTMHEI